MFRRLFGARPAAEIEPAEIAAYIRRMAERTPAEARNRLGHLRRMYSWAIGSGDFGLTVNPCSALKPADLIGRKVARDRILTMMRFGLSGRRALNSVIPTAI